MNIDKQFKRWLFWVHDLLFCIFILLHAKCYIHKSYFYFPPESFTLFYHYAYVHMSMCVHVVVAAACTGVLPSSRIQSFCIDCMDCLRKVHLYNLTSIQEYILTCIERTRFHSPDKYWYTVVSYINKEVSIFQQTQYIFWVYWVYIFICVKTV